MDIISEREDNPSNCQYDKFVGLEHYVSGEVEIKNYGSTDLLKSAMKVFHAGDILIARRNVYLRRAGITNFEGITSGDSIVLRAKDELIKKLLPFVLNTDDFWEYALKFSDGTMSKRLSPKILVEYEFNLPDIKEQEKLAELLWTANDTKQAYKKLLSLTDDLVKSQFIEMFGDNKFEEISLREISSIITKGTTPTTYGFNFIDEGINFVKVESVCEDGSFDTSKFMYISEECNEKLTRSKLCNGDILFSIAGAIGRTAIVDNSILPANTNQALAIIRLNHDISINRLYLIQALKSEKVRQQYELQKQGIAQLNLSLQNIGDLTINIPQIEIQNQFAEFVQQTDKSKFELKQTISNLENMIKSLMVRYLC